MNRFSPMPEVEFYQITKLIEDQYKKVAEN